ncbi:hypothetical protein N0V84_002045 [Fusarium piperis]|uniref:Peptidase S8/S53 domain-containing protein n=1 Tax=Fusarium piperis TaxID=1435070 RepID=A0A9W8WJW3_9HYPO|nr:hypothetical protein N0V84_002045 [Fusarium piperis]
MDDQDGNHIDTLKKQIRLIIRSIANCDETKILDLMNSRTELSFQLRLTLLELRNDRTLSQDDERSSRYVRSLLEVLRGLTEDPHQAALARISCDEADSPEPSLVRLPQTAEELRAAAQKISNLRKLNSSRHDVQSDPERGRDYTNPHHRTTTRDGSHLNEVDKSEGENECHNFNESEVEPPRNGRDPSFSVSLGCKSPATAEFQNIIPKELLDQLRDKQTAAGEFMRSAKTFHEEKIIPLKSNKLIKVAVLDTGVDKGEPYFMRGVSGTSIKDAKSFIDDSPHDIDGHGTRVAALVKAIAPHVDLYIAKVCHEHKTVVEDQYAKRN